MQREGFEIPTMACVAGRLDYNTILSTAFGPDFKKLYQNPQALGGALGSLARIFEAMAKVEGNSRLSLPVPCRYHNDASYGKGFIINLVQHFPELTSLRDRMEEAVRQDLTNAFAKYESYITALRLACNCRICQEGPWVQDAYCCVLILEVIASMARTMSVVTVPIGIFPSRLGLETVYGQQFLLRKEVKDEPRRKQELQEYGPAYFVISRDEKPIIDAMRIFCGRLPLEVDMYGGNCAVSIHGICVYYGTLSHLSDDSESVSQVIVVPGKIQLQGKDYRLMKDLTNEHTQETRGWPSALMFTEFSVLVKETTSSLQIAFEVSGSDPRSHQKMLIYPQATIDDLAISRGLVSCSRLTCENVIDNATVKDEKQGYKLYELAGVEIESFEANSLQRWILMSLKRVIGNKILLVDKECIHCCSQAAVKAVQNKEATRAILICVNP